MLFAAVYFGANALAVAGGSSRELHAAWERSIPFMPGAIAVYFSIAVVFLLPLFAFDEAGLAALAARFAAVTLIAGAVFVAYPVRIGFDRPPVVDGYGAVFAALYCFDAPYNTVPSLHIAYSTLILGGIALGTRSLWLRTLLLLWLAAIGASVLLVHQHHVIDVLAGALLGGLGLMRRRRA